MTRDDQRLTRDAIEAGVMKRLLMSPGSPFRVYSELELEHSLNATLAARPSGDGADIWIFAYGSLIWNPTFAYCARMPGAIHGWHRRFCVGAPLGRGTLEQPGIVLGLDRGGSCRGVAYRIRADQVGEELAALWRREMVIDCYEPRWVRVEMRSSSAFAITFVVKRSAPNYEGPICKERLIDRLVAASGELGSNADYLLETVEGLRLAQVPDRHLEVLAAAVEAKRGLPPRHE
jgi:cation transport protein ChaC